MDQALTIFDILHSQGDERTVDRMKRIFLKCLLKDGLNGGCRKRMARTKESMYEQNFQTSTKQEEDQGEEIYLRLHFLFFSLSLARSAASRSAASSSSSSSSSRYPTPFPSFLTPSSSLSPALSASFSKARPPALNAAPPAAP